MNVLCFAKTANFNTFDRFDVRLAAMYEGMWRSGTLDYFFHAAAQRFTREDFVRFATADARWVYAYFDPATQQPLCMAVFSDFSGRAAMCHFASMGAGGSVCHALARHCMHLVCNDNALSCLVGLTPACFRHSVRFAESVGFVRIATVKNACLVRSAKGALKYRDGMLLKYER